MLFDETAFLADVDAYKATKDIALTATVDYFKATTRYSYIINSLVVRGEDHAFNLLCT